ncbi:conserved hypothetical protein [Trichinella spiralis]|uniref:hypothetical protein n=1 Tax=Trichinella spiralis TaxID=6334 RepID=UPI0001EFEF7F|nr:conserved hypothetical protein [Trichinella spiralis]
MYRLAEVEVAALFPRIWGSSPEARVFRAVSKSQITVRPISLPVHKQWTSGTSLPATKAWRVNRLLIPLRYNLECTIHAPGSTGCQQSNVVTRSKDQYVPRCTLPQ